MATIPTQTRFPTSAQVPDQAIMNKFGKASYLGNYFSLPISRVSISGTSEVNIALIQNPSTATKSLFMWHRSISAISFLAQFKFYIAPTATAGTTATPVNMRPANGNLSVSACSTAPTSSANGTLIQTLECATGSAPSVDSDYLIILDPGQSMLITCTPGGTTLISLNMSWFEI